MELSRRRFMQFLSAAPVALAFDPHRKIFDMGRSQIWTPPPPEIIVPSLGQAYIELGLLHLDRSIAMMLAQFNEQMEQTIIGPVQRGPYVWSEAIDGNREQEFLRKIDAIASR
jgi:hypothetical protein